MPTAGKFSGLARRVRNVVYCRKTTKKWYRFEWITTRLGAVRGFDSLVFIEETGKYCLLRFLFNFIYCIVKYMCNAACLSLKETHRRILTKTEHKKDVLIIFC